jgi:hypothetical protein
MLVIDQFLESPFDTGVEISAGGASLFVKW